MKTNAMESLHRSVVSKFNETRGRFPFIYYRDVEVEPAILPLVELLNNEWTLIALFDCAAYDQANPPLGLPLEALARCSPDAEPPPADRHQPTNPAEPTWFRQSPLRCRAMIHMMPMEE